MIVHDEKTWPLEVIACLEKHKDVFLAWEQRRIDQTPHIQVSGPVYDAAMGELWDALSGFSLRGYHCTRLTEAEIEHIISNGMTPQNGSSLRQRIDALVSTGHITNKIADSLKNENQADEEYRAEMIWFCFFPPHKAEQGGIERFFRSWGGEALYNSHEDDQETGAAISQIGIPCVVEADAPIADHPHSFLTTKLTRIFLINRGFRTRECTDHEGYATTHIPAQNIHRVIRFPENNFFALTKADTWEPPL